MGSKAVYAAPLVLDETGNVYGTTYTGGDVQGPCADYGGCGVVYRVDSTGPETVLYSFPGGTLGANPNPFGRIVWGGDGGLYDTNVDGGQYREGTVYRLDGARSTLLHAFTGGADGGQPWAGVIQDPQGNLYGTTAGGGIPCVYYSGCGVVYKIDPSGSETVLYSFTGGADGGLSYAGLVRDPAGNLYGTTLFGGEAGGICDGTCGVVFMLNPSGEETVLYTFTDGADGANPYSSLVMDKDGNLYGTALVGGDLSGCSGGGCGVVFKLTRSAGGK